MHMGMWDLEPGDHQPDASWRKHGLLSLANPMGDAHQVGCGVT